MDPALLTWVSITRNLTNSKQISCTPAFAVLVQAYQLHFHIFTQDSFMFDGNHSLSSTICSHANVHGVKTGEILYRFQVSLPKCNKLPSKINKVFLSEEMQP